MTDAAIGEMPAEPVPLPPIPPAPVANAELDAAAPAEKVDQAAPEADAPGDVPTAPADRALPEIEYAIGGTRQAILDHFLDTEGDQTMAQIKAALPTVLPTTVEASVRREWEAGRLLRVSPGTYRLAPAKPAEQPKSPKPPPPQPEEDVVWFDALERWAVDPASWNTEQFGPPPNQPNNIPQDIKLRFNDRLRKRAERRREAEAAAARRTAADAELRDKLIAATGGNIVRGSGIEDVAPIKLALELVPIDRILSAIRSKTDRKMFPGNAAATSWREDRLLREIAENYCRTEIVPNLIAAWSGAGRTPAPTVPIAPPAGLMPDDIDELRSRHDDPSAPPGPHVMPQPNAAPNMLGGVASASEPPAAVEAPPESENASTVSSENGSALSGDSVAEPGPEPVSELPDGAPPEATAEPAAPAAVGREQILAAFTRSWVPPQPTPAPPATSQPRSSQAPNATIRRQAEPAEREISPEAWDDYVAGFRVGNEKHLGVQIGTVVEQHATILEPAEQPGVSFTEPNGPRARHPFAGQ